MMGGAAVCFEAKRTDADRMEQDRVTPEQADRLERCHAYGGHAFVKEASTLTGFPSSHSP